MKTLIIASLTLSALGPLFGTSNQVPIEPPAIELPSLSAAQTMDTVQLEPDPASLSAAQRLARGRTVYRRSCVNCHGIQPQGLAHEDAQRFTVSVLEGRGEMPALGFKLDAAEVQVARFYVAVCSRDYSIC